MKVNHIKDLLIFFSIAGIVAYLFMNNTKQAYVISDTLVSEYQGMKDAKLAFQQKQTVWNANIDSLRYSINLL